MILRYIKGIVPNCNGGQPPNPRDFTLYGPEQGRRAEPKALPHVPVTDFGAQVASQQSRILRTGPGIVTKLVRKSNWQTGMKLKLGQTLS